MRDWRAKLARRAKEGDDNLVTLFQALAVLAIAVASVAVAPRHGDTLLRRVPRSAVIYVHAQGSGLDRLGSFLPHSIAVTKPSEVGVFAMSDSTGDLSWAWLLRWPSGRVAAGVPCEASLADGTCLIVANQSMRDKQTAALHNDTASLVMDRRLAKSLAAVRGLSLVQAYVQPGGFRNLASEGVSLPGPTVMAWNRDGVTTAWPVGSPVVPQLGRLSQPRLAADAIMTVGGMNEDNVQAPMQVVLGEKMKVTNRPMLAQLESIFARTSYFSLGTTETDYQIHLRGVSRARLADNLTVYFSSLQPIERPLTMPDGQVAIETTIDVSDLDFLDDGQGKWKLVSRTQTIKVPDLAVKDDGMGGVWLLGGSYASGPFTPPVEGNHRQACFRSKANSYFNPLDEVILGSPSTCVVEGVDKSVIIYRNFPQ